MYNFAFFSRGEESASSLNGYDLHVASDSSRGGVAFMPANFRSMSALEAVGAECGRLGFNPKPSHAFARTL